MSWAGWADGYQWIRCQCHYREDAIIGKERTRSDKKGKRVRRPIQAILKADRALRAGAGLQRATWRRMDLKWGSDKEEGGKWAVYKAIRLVQDILEGHKNIKGANNSYK
jgi:hypothetical protein